MTGDKYDPETRTFIRTGRFARFSSFEDRATSQGPMAANASSAERTESGRDSGSHKEETIVYEVYKPDPPKRRDMPVSSMSHIDANINAALNLFADVTGEGRLEKDWSIFVFSSAMAITETAQIWLTPRAELSTRDSPEQLEVLEDIRAEERNVREDREAEKRRETAAERAERTGLDNKQRVDRAAMDAKHLAEQAALDAKQLSRREVRETRFRREDHARKEWQTQSLRRLR